jgi:hypothetical protein
LDYIARELIRYCLARAAEDALNKSKEWVALAKAAGIEDPVESPVIRFVAEESDLLNTAAPNEIERKTIEDRIRQLEAFSCMTSDLLADLKKQLDKTSAPRGL